MRKRKNGIFLKKKGGKGDLKVELDVILNQEEILWRPRSRVQWLEHGDRNTRYFHIQASARRRKNTICRIEYESQTFDKPAKIKQIFSNYFSDLFSSPGIESNIKPAWEVLYQDYLGGRSQLERPFTEKETKNVVFGLAKEEAPGPDGFPGSFYQRY